MEKVAKPKNKIFKFLPKAASAVVSFQNPPFSPGRDKRFCHAGKGFSGPIISIIPDEARRKKKSDDSSGSVSFGAQEPTSPKVSCMGQIKHKKKTHKKPIPLPEPNHSKPSTPIWSPRVVKKHAAAICRIFAGKTGAAKSSDDNKKQPPEAAAADRAPSLGQMRRFASGRDALANFDWTAQITPVDSDHRNHRNYYSDEDRVWSEEEGEEEDEEVIIPFSAPMVVGGDGEMSLQPRKEVNLWKRRTMAPPRPLQLHKLVRSY